MSKGTVRQQATISAVSETEITLDVCRAEACAACAARGACGGGAQKEMTLVNDGSDYQVGEQVTLVMERSMGLKAVLIAYLIPVFIIITSLLVFQSFEVSELISGGITLLILAIYMLMIRLFRDTISREISIRIEKN